MLEIVVVVGGFGGCEAGFFADCSNGRCGAVVDEEGKMGWGDGHSSGLRSHSDLCNGN